MKKSKDYVKGLIAKAKGQEKTTLEVTNDEKAIIRRAMEYYLNQSPFCQENHPNNKVEGFACFTYFEAEFKAITQGWLKKDFANMVKGATPIASGNLEQVINQLTDRKKSGSVRHFDRHANMGEPTRKEILELISAHWVDMKAKDLYGSISKDFPKIHNYLFGMFDGYDYSSTRKWLEEMSTLKNKDVGTYRRIERVVEEISQYPTIPTPS